MMKVLREAYAHPARRAAYYSANGALTASDRLNAQPFWDWTPQPSQGVPGVSTCMFPLALGCAPRILDGGKEWIFPRFRDPREALDYEPPPLHAGRCGAVLDAARRVVANLGPNELLREPDIQSPLGIAEMMWDESFYLTLADAPDAVHALLDRITDFVIAFVLEIQAIAGDRLNPAGFPPIWARGRGTMISDDSMSLVSPAMHREFSIPYVNRIADACGPVWYHSCTWRAAYFDNLRLLRNIICWNWNPGNSDDSALILREFSGTAVLAPHIVREMHLDNDLLPFGFADEAALLKHMLDNMQDNTTLYFWFSNIREKGPVIERMADMLAERGYNPAARLANREPTSVPSRKGSCIG
jgi:hypothetical protein